MNIVSTLADALQAAAETASCLPPPSSTHAGFDLAQAYAVADELRRRRIASGDAPRGYKIGFTNRSIWPRYGVYAPIWGPVWQSTLTLLDGSEATLSLAGLCQPRLEPEIVFGFARPPHAGMSEPELAGCIDWVAHGLEVVHTHFEAWRFAAPDTVADGALHGRLLVGPRVPVARFGDAAALGPALAALELTLQCGGKEVDRGRADVVLDGPLNALRLWVDAMAAQPQHWPICAGDVVTTGTITDAWPMVHGQHWQTRLSDPRLQGLRLDVRS